MLRKFKAEKGSTTYRQVAALLFAFLWGCGGGGGGGPAGLTPPPSTPVAVTAANATQVSATALKPAVGGGGALGTASGVETTAAPQPRAVTRALLAVSRDSKTQLSASQSVVAAAANTTPCHIDGTKTVDISADGTSGTITFNACSEVAGETISGSASATGVSVAPDRSRFSGNFRVDLTFTANGFAPLRVVGSFSIDERDQPGRPAGQPNLVHHQLHDHRNIRFQHPDHYHHRPLHGVEHGPERLRGCEHEHAAADAGG